MALSPIFVGLVDGRNGASAKLHSSVSFSVLLPPSPFLAWHRETDSYLPSPSFFFRLFESSRRWRPMFAQK